ncbi:HAD hydrolase family protein [Candidatus Thioglobus sp.]|nr:HAD hydrolase family protein [Candidatus Thioglobus sp.]
MNYSIDNIDAFVFDFDGVLTNNFVYLDQSGIESVRCSRGDGLAFDLLRKINKPAYILSTETNSVVTARAKKLKIEAIQGVLSKEKAINGLAETKGFDLNKICYVGNDLNDYGVMKLCGYSACPSDSHPLIKEIATFNLTTKGGYGVVRELLEKIMQIDFINILFSKEEV